MSDDTDLPKALVKKIAKSKLVSLERENGTQEVRDIQISKDALLALSESARVFIHYLTATGNDICKESKRQIMSVDDIFTALDDLEFGELLPPLKESLEGFKVESKEKSKKRAEQQKKRKLEDAEKQATEAAFRQAAAEGSALQQAPAVGSALPIASGNALNLPVAANPGLTAVQDTSALEPSTKAARVGEGPPAGHDSMLHQGAGALTDSMQDTVMHSIG